MEQYTLALDDFDQMHITEGLQALLTVKREALATVQTYNPYFTERDFGIPRIEALSKRLMEAFYGPEEDDSELPKQAIR